MLFDEYKSLKFTFVFTVEQNYVELHRKKPTNFFSMENLRICILILVEKRTTYTMLGATNNGKDEELLFKFIIQIRLSQIRLSFQY